MTRFAVDQRGMRGPDTGGSAGSGTTFTVTSGGNLGSSYTFTPQTGFTMLTGTLTANCALTLSGLQTGYNVRLLLTQNGTGGWTLTVNGTSVTIPTGANLSCQVDCSYDGTTLFASVEGVINSSAQPIGWRQQVIPTFDYTAVTDTLSFDTTILWGRMFNSGGTVNGAYQFNNVFLVAGTWTLEWGVEQFTNGAINTVAVDGTTVGTIDSYAASNAPALMTLAGITIATAGLHTVKFTAATKNASSGGFYLITTGVAFRRTA